MQAGALRERVNIQTLTKNRDGAGGIDPSWATTLTLWASVEPMTGAEYYEAEQQRAIVNARIRLRYRSDITTAQRVVHGSTTYRIHAVINRHSDLRETQLLCSVVT